MPDATVWDFTADEARELLVAVTVGLAEVLALLAVVLLGLGIVARIAR